ncbi:thiopeptide-type bacteriocin biosynthesis domain-containing protein [Dyadobacter koreensis]|uniref:Thiopeptide-type bacteriocin biosynthesis domain-containing protein n=1 Tax=Dyadobacter koreensis TaxID=408657 RepID=A0A1H6QRD4_9BACT|nr:lantibiotic dehydratase [Dyadobacter koreensis]SEI46169.1 thiopeptide-type bacteriocin biosynthesis domain-containing protein [Dyadobacter koreensis]
MKPQSYGFCVFRRPLLSKNILEDFHARIQDAPSVFESELHKIFSDPVLLEGLQLASGTLYGLAKDFVTGKPVSGKQKLLMSLYKFLIRAASRCTPFGLFAGYFTIQTGQSTRILFSRQRPRALRSQLDSTAKLAIRAKILENTRLRSQLLFYPNSSLYRAGQNYRYLKRQQQSGFVLTQVRFDPLLEKILAEAATGISPAQIKNLLKGENLGVRRADAYADALIRSQMFTDSLMPKVSGEDYLTYLKSVLGTLKYARPLTAALQKIQTQLALNAQATEVNRALTDFLKADHPLESTLHSTLRFQTLKARISGRVLQRLGRQLDGLSFLSRPGRSEDLDNFTSRFYMRYGQQPVPLLVALDYDYGMGYGSLSEMTQPKLPLLGGLRDNAPPVKTPEANINDLAGALYQRAVDNRVHTVLLTDELLKKHQNPSAALPSSFYVLGSFHACCQRALDAGDFLFELKALAGPSASSLLTRFCPGDPGLTRHVERIMEHEKANAGDLILAQIAHLPAGKAANIVQRPDLGSYQISYLAGAGNSAGKTIRTDDLWLSCQDGKNLILTSRNLQKRIIPALSSAHNFSSGLPVYRFLCDLASQHTASVFWDWAGYSDAAYLPRVQYNQLILSKASWLLTDAEEPSPLQSKTDWWKTVEKKLNTPRYFTVGQQDQTLLIDSKSEQALSLLSQLLKKNGHVRISESLDRPGQGILKQGGQHFSNEVVIPYFTHARPAVQAELHQVPTGGVARRFCTGSRWLYVKLYCAESLSDLLITQALAPLMASLQKQKIIQKWFFIRYNDPEPHLRLRFYSEKKHFWALVLGQLQKAVEPLLESGMVRNMQTDTYQRELERYPSKLYEKIESVFHCDSQAVFSALDAVGQDPDRRWQAALWATDKLLSDFDLDLNEKRILVEKMHQQFAAELDGDGTLRRVMDENYRAQRQRIETILGLDQPVEISKLAVFFQKRSIRIGRLTKSPALIGAPMQLPLCTDLIHLFLNRWFFTRQRQQEFVIYHYLKKYYTSVMKNKNSKKIFPQVVNCN